VEAQLPVWWISVLAPAAAGGLVALLRLKPRRAAYLVALALLIPAAATMHYLANGLVGGGVWDPIAVDLTRYGIGSFMLFVDGISAPVVIGISLVTALVAVYSVKYMVTRIEEMREAGENPPGMNVYFLLYAAFAATMIGMALANNLIEFYVFLELSLIMSFLLILYYGYGDRKKIALLYFVWTHVAGALFLAGILYYGVNAGSFDVALPAPEGVVYVAPASLVLGAAAGTVAVLVIAGLFIKMAVLGVHMWLPYAHAEAPTPVSALLSPNLIGIAGYALARFAVPLFPESMASLAKFMMGLGLATIVYGGLVALRQDDFKRFLAYSSVSQMGYLLLGIGTLTAAGVAGAILHYLTHAFGKAVLFMVAGVFITELHGLRKMSLMGGLARAYPITAAAALLGFMHLVGMPPTLGMWSELLITIGVVDAFPGGGGAGVELYSSNAQVALLALLLIIAYGVSAGYAFIAMKRIFFGQLSEHVKSLGVGPGYEVLDEFKAVIVLAGALGVFYFIAVNLLAGPLQASVDQLLQVLGW